MAVNHVAQLSVILDRILTNVSRVLLEANAMTVTNEGELRAVYRPPAARAAQKVLDRLDIHCRNFIALSPFCVLSSCDASGQADASPRGDPRRGL